MVKSGTFGIDPRSFQSGPWRGKPEFPGVSKFSTGRGDTTGPRGKPLGAPRTEGKGSREIPGQKGPIGVGGFPRGVWGGKTPGGGLLGGKNLGEFGGEQTGFRAEYRRPTFRGRGGAKTTIRGGETNLLGGLKSRAGNIWYGLHKRGG